MKKHLKRRHKRKVCCDICRKINQTKLVASTSTSKRHRTCSSSAWKLGKATTIPENLEKSPVAIKEESTQLLEDKFQGKLMYFFRPGLFQPRFFGMFLLSAVLAMLFSYFVSYLPLAGALSMGGDQPPGLFGNLLPAAT